MLASWTLAKPAWMSLGRLTSGPFVRNFMRRPVESTYFSAFPPRHQLFSSPIRFTHETTSGNAGISAESTKYLAEMHGAIKASNLAEADRIRTSLQDLGLHIPANNIYKLALTMILQQPDYLTYLSSFSAWLSLCPNASEPNEVAFPHTIRFLLSDPKKNMPLIKIFGIACAQKGYISMAKETILYAVKRFGDREMLQELRDEIQRSETRLLVESPSSEPTSFHSQEG